MPEERTQEVGYSDVVALLSEAADRHERGDCSFLPLEHIAEEWLRGLWSDVENRGMWTMVQP